MFVEHSASEIAKVNRTIISDNVYLDFNHFELCLLFTFDLDIKGRVFILNCCKQASKYFIHLPKFKRRTELVKDFMGRKLIVILWCRKLAAILCKMVSSETLSFTDLFSLGDFRETCHRCWRQYDTTVEYEQLSQPVRCHGSLAGHKVQGHSSKSVHIMALQLK